VMMKVEFEPTPFRATKSLSPMMEMMLLRKSLT